MSVHFAVHSLSSIGVAVLSLYLDEYINKNALYTKRLEQNYFSNIFLCTLSCIYTFIYAKFFKKKKMNLSKKNTILNIFCGLVYAMHIFVMHYSLKFMSYPIKIIFLSAKLLIAMPINVISRVRKKNSSGFFFGYTLKELLVSVLIFVGIVMVLLPNDKNKPLDVAVESSSLSKAFDFEWKGVILLVLSINLGCVFDELQSLMMRDSKPGEGGEAPDTTVILCWNMLSCVVFLTLGVISSGLAKDVIKIVRTDKQTVLLTVFLGVVNVLVQVIMISLKKSFGTWWKNIISALAKCCAIVFSIIFFGHLVTPLQIFGIFFVFGCVIMAGQIELNRNKTIPSTSSSSSSSSLSSPSSSSASAATTSNSSSASLSLPNSQDLA